MRMNRREFVAALSMLATSLAHAEGDKPANRNIKWALSEALWRYYPPGPFTDMLEVMQETGFIGVRLAGFPHILSDYNLTQAQMLSEVSKRNLTVVTISWNGALHDPAQRQAVLSSARNAMKFLADFGANHLVVFSPNRNLPATQTPAAFRELCERCNQIGELAGEIGFTAGLHIRGRQAPKIRPRRTALRRWLCGLTSLAKLPIASLIRFHHKALPIGLGGFR